MITRIENNMELCVSENASIINELRDYVTAGKNEDAVKKRSNVKPNSLILFVFLTALAFFSQPLYSQETLLPAHRIFNIAPIKLPDRFLLPEERERLEALQDVVEILGQEFSISRIFDKLEYGKEMPNVPRSEYVEQKRRDLLETSTSQGLSSIETSIEYDNYTRTFARYGKILFVNQPKNGALFRGRPFYDILLLKHKYFGDRIVLINVEGYLEFDISGPDPTLEDVVAGVAWNRIVKATIVAYENNLITTLYFDKNSNLRDLSYSEYENPFEFYDIQSQNDPAELQRMKDEDTLESYARLFKDSLPSTESVVLRRLIWSENGSLLAHSVTTNFKRDTEKFSPKAYFEEVYPPVAFVNVPFKTDKLPEIKNGLTAEEDDNLSKSYKSIVAFSELNNIYEASNVLSSVEGGLFSANVNGSDQGLTFLSLRPRNTISDLSLVVTLGDVNKVLRFAANKSDVRKSSSVQGEERRNQFVGLSVQWRDPSVVFTFAFPTSRGGTTEVITIHRPDENAKYAYVCYPHATCRRTTLIAKVCNSFFAYDKFVISHSCVVNDDGTVEKEVFHDPNDPANLVNGEALGWRQLILITQ